MVCRHVCFLPIGFSTAGYFYFGYWYFVLIGMVHVCCRDAVEVVGAVILGDCRFVLLFDSMPFGVCF